MRRVSTSTASRAGGSADGERHAPLDGVGLVVDDRPLDHLGEVGHLGHQLHPAGIELGQLEDVVDEHEELAAGGDDVLEVALLLLGVERPGRARRAPPRRTR